MESGRALSEIEGDAQYFVEESDLYALCLCELAFLDMCPPIIFKLQQFSRRSGGHSRRIPGVLRTTNHKPHTYALICTNVSIEAKLGHQGLDFLLFGTSMEVQQVKTCLD